MVKDDGAFLTIGELARELGVAQHILRYWESRFPQLRPLQRSGNRRYYRPSDVALARRINSLLNEQGFTVRGAQRALEGDKSLPRSTDASPGSTAESSNVTSTPPVSPPPQHELPASRQGELPILNARNSAAAPAENQVEGSDIAVLIARLTVIRENLAEALNVAQS